MILKGQNTLTDLGGPETKAGQEADMTVNTQTALEQAYGLVKQHEASLASVAQSAYRVERDIFGDLLSDTRNMAYELEAMLSEKGIVLTGIRIPTRPGLVTPRVLSDQRTAIEKAYAIAISETPVGAPSQVCLQAQYDRFIKSGQKLEVLCAAVVSDQ